jgi:hypothetical protein
MIGIIYILWTSGWVISNAIAFYSNLKKDVLFTSALSLIGLIFLPLTMKKWYDKNYNHTNITHYKNGIKIPNNLKDID